MPPTRRRLVHFALAAPAALILIRPSTLIAQDDQAFSALADPANVFISPCGRPFRARMDAPYPVVDWFRKADADGDGKLDHAEFIADALAFFQILDRNGDGVISPTEVAFYEQRIAPEVLGMRVDVRGGVAVARPVLMTVQQTIPQPGAEGPGGGPLPSGVGGPGDHSEGDSHLGAPEDEFPHSAPYDASGVGASPYGFFDEPEPISAADTRMRGYVSKADFVAHAEAHFTTLDTAGKGYLTLDTLPKTPVQRRLERGKHKRH